jgi:hypothetical protein
MKNLIKKSRMKNLIKKSRRAKILKYLGSVGMAFVSIALITSPSVAALEPSEIAAQALGNEGGRLAAKEALNTALKTMRSKPSLIIATTVVCTSCVPAAGAVASPSLCIACGILVAKILK